MKYFKDINYNNIAALEARVKAIEGADLYNLSQVIKIYVVLNVSAPKVHRNSMPCHSPQVPLQQDDKSCA